MEENVLAKELDVKTNGVVK